MLEICGILHLHKIVQFYWTSYAYDIEDVGSPLVHCTCVLLTCFRLRKKVCEGHRDFRKSLGSASCHTGRRVWDRGASRDVSSDVNNGLLTVETPRSRKHSDGMTVGYHKVFRIPFKITL